MLFTCRCLPLIKDLTEGDDVKEIDCDLCLLQVQDAETSLYFAPQTPSASCCSSPPAPLTWHPPPPHSHRQTQDFRPRQVSQGPAILSTEHKLHLRSEVPSSGSKGNKSN